MYLMVMHIRFTKLIHQKAHTIVWSYLMTGTKDYLELPNGNALKIHKGTHALLHTSPLKVN